MTARRPLTSYPLLESSAQDSLDRGYDTDALVTCTVLVGLPGRWPTLSKLREGCSSQIGFVIAAVRSSLAVVGR